ncbi:auxin-induced protein X10A [Brachypodium distachyon]|uniref:auxin-induced protein X10A n=1 Tax=Brachypodium distachyon TaxID=15368 RepID=UPI00052FFC5C|nr:auxin-induced protein X10A [Brachypodium distachyon]|eukprot:XP_010240728.1 auxin-induced protein X10A [Brachypodium distachyon]
MMMIGVPKPPGAEQLVGERRSKAAAERAEMLDGTGEEALAVPRGYIAVYVGAEERRFMVHVSYLCQPAFRALMELAAEVFGFGLAGGLHFSCREEEFLAIVAQLDSAQWSDWGCGQEVRTADPRVETNSYGQ